MNLTTRLKCRLLIATLVVLVVVAGACSSRYSLNLAVATEGLQKNFKIEQTQFVTEGVLADPYSETKLVPGDGSVAVLTIGSRWDKMPPSGTSVKIVRFDEYLRMRLYLGFPSVLEPQRFEADGRSFVQLLGRYDWSPEDRIFVPNGGSFTIDSVNSKLMFVTVDGRYRNQAGDSLSVLGQFKLKISQ